MNEGKKRHTCAKYCEFGARIENCCLKGTRLILLRVRNANLPCRNLLILPRRGVILCILAMASAVAMIVYILGFSLSRYYHWPDIKKALRGEK